MHTWNVQQEKSDSAAPARAEPARLFGGRAMKPLWAQPNKGIAHPLLQEKQLEALRNWLQSLAETSSDMLRWTRAEKTRECAT